MTYPWKDLPGRIREWVNLNRSARPVSHGACCSLGITTKEIWLAVGKESNDLAVELLVSYPLRKQADLEKVLGRAIRKHHLQGMTCSLTLYPDQYQLFLMDMLPVEPSEFQSAIRWKLVELLSYPVEEALVDHFMVPAQKSHDPRPMMMVAVARAGHLKKLTEIIRGTGLHVTSIGIQELALRNISRLFEKEERSSALVYLETFSCEVIVTRLGLLYLQRHLEPLLDELGDITATPDEVLKGNPALEKLSLELQRSFDYFQSQWRHAHPSQVLLTGSPSPAVLELIATYLASRLAIPVRVLPIREVLTFQQTPDADLQGNFLPVLGSLIRRERKSHATGN